MDDYIFINLDFIWAVSKASYAFSRSIRDANVADVEAWTFTKHARLWGGKYTSCANAEEQEFICDYIDAHHPWEALCVMVMENPLFFLPFPLMNSSLMLFWTFQ